MGLFDEVTALSFRNKNVKSIVRNRDGAIIYQKVDDSLGPYIELVMDTRGGKTHIDPHEHYETFYPVENVWIDWGDGSELQKYDSEFGNYGSFFYTYETEGIYTVKIYGVERFQYSGCFEDIQALVSVIMPNNITDINTSTFSGCESLTSVILSNQTTELTDYCFSNCTSLLSITIPDSVTIIGESCFEGCASLETVTLPEGLTRIKYGAFSYCDSLTSIVIPQSVNSLESSLFAHSSSFENIEFKWTDEDDILFYNEQNSFAGLTNNFTITIPYGTTDLYVDKYYPLEKLVEKEDLYTSSTVRIQWAEESGETPVSVSISYRFEEETVSSHGYNDNIYELNSNNNWEFTLNNLPKQIDGQNVTYIWIFRSLSNEYKAIQPVYNWYESNYDPTQNLTIIYLKKK